ncbi:hypothetical protein [Prochlorococcus marinus]|uniref:hypothetical protein n=1 Tax=Prochlorococcus marinus TaxID=1219 RepID=UPI0022B36D40|nr:hypothetical protein [Prochlorococcus marinus]
MTDSNDRESFNWKKIFTSLTFFLCALSLVFIAISLRPVAQWAQYQNICVDQESQKSPIEWSVRKCNGRSKVYQVK